ncbi:MAG: type II secretion system F family protein [Actinomycetota bacterium]
MTAGDIAPALAATATICVAAGLGSARRGGPHRSLVVRGSSEPVVRRRLRFGPHRRLFARLAERRYRAEVDAEIPQLLDLLAAGSSAGLAAPLALRRAVDGLVGPLADEIGTLVRAVDVGARWRDELEALDARLDLPDLRRTVAALTRTESLGSSLAQATSELAASVRRTRRAATTERARTAPVKMLFPLVFLVLPAFLLLTVVPVLLTTVQSIG